MNVILTVTTTAQPLPAGVTAGQLQFSITDAAGAAVGAAVMTNDLSATFSGIPSGDYLGHCARLDAAGNVLGNAVTQAFSVAASASFDEPASMVVTFS